MSDATMLAFLRVAILLSLARPAAAEPTTTYDLTGGRVEGERAVPEISFISISPITPLPAYDDKTAAPRLVALDRAIASARDPVERANALFARARWLISRARHERILWISALLRADEVKDPMTRRARTAKAAPLKAAVTRTHERAIVDLIEITCTPEDGERGKACAVRWELSDWTRMDEAVFQLGQLLSRERRDAESVRTYQRLVDDFPYSRLLGDAAVAVGEDAFERGDLALAERMYLLAQGSLTPMVRAYAQYKLGWVQLNRGRNQEAFATFVAVATSVAANPASPLERAARKDAVRAYAAWGSASDASATFERNVPGDLLDLLDQLGEQWLDGGRSEDAIAIFTEAQRRAPFDPRQCEWQASVTRAAIALIDEDRKFAELARLRAALARVRKLRNMPARLLEECIDKTRSLGDALAGAHDRWDRTSR